MSVELRHRPIATSPPMAGSPSTAPAETGAGVRWRVGTGVATAVSRLLIAVCIALTVWGASGCGSRPKESVVVYAAQDRVYAEPLFREFEAATGIQVRPVYDNEATKTTGLANRLLAEISNPQADLWWSNEEMRTRQLVSRGALVKDWVRFGERRRVLVCDSNRWESLGRPASLASLTNRSWQGRVALAFPLFGTTSAHFLALRQRWGESAWKAWCTALYANRPLIVDGNSVVVRLVGAGDAWIGLTDSDDVEAARREGSQLISIPLTGADAWVIPNTLAIVQGSRRPEAARRLSEFLRSPPVVQRLVSAGALEPGPETVTGGASMAGDGDPLWEPLLHQLESGLKDLEALFRR